MTVKVAVYFDVQPDVEEQVMYSVMTILGHAVPYMADNVEIVMEEA